jgi:hypothetical protein
MILRIDAGEPAVLLAGIHSSGLPVRLVARVGYGRCKH